MAPDEVTLRRTLCLDMLLAHTVFQSGKYDDAIQQFDSIINASTTSSTELVKAHCLCTKGRAYLESYILQAEDLKYFDLALESLNESLAIYREKNQYSEMFICEKFLAHLWKTRVEGNPRAAVTALQHVKNAEKLLTNLRRNLKYLPLSGSLWTLAYGLVMT